MKLTSVELHPNNSSYIGVLSFRDPGRANPYNVKAIIGLDADDIVSRFYAGSGDLKFYNLSLEKRDIVIRIALNPRFNLNESYSGLRDELYKIISSSRTGLVEIQFKNDEEVVAVVYGFVKKFEAAHFNKEQEVQITLNCPDPILRAPTPVSVVLDDVDPALVNLEDLLSTAPHGFKFELHMIDNIPGGIEMSVFGDDTWSFEVTPDGGFLFDDVLYFSSEYNDKHLYIMRPGVTDPIHLADKIVVGSVWPIMFPGDNELVFSNPTDVEFDSISYYPTYWGV